MSEKRREPFLQTDELHPLREHLASLPAPPSMGPDLFQEDSLHLLLETMNEGLGVQDRTGRIVWVNRRFCEMLGYEREELLGRPVTDFVEESQLAHFRSQMERRRKGAPSSYELTMRRKDGRLVHTLQSGTALLDQEGRHLGSFAVITDITPLKETQDSLRLSHFCIDTAAEMIFWVDAQGRLRYANQSACRQLGYSPQEISEITVLDLNPNRTRESWQQIFESLRNRGSLTFETQHRRRNGQLFPVEITANYFSYGGEELVCAFVRDISARKAQEQELRQREAEVVQLQKMEAIGLLAGGVAHDFNNLLTVIIGHVELMLNSLSLNPEVMRDLQVIRSTAEQAAALTRQLLAFSRKQVLQPQPVRLNQLVSKMEKILGRLIGENVRLLTRTEATADWIRVDPTQAEQVIINLAINARDAMPEGGTLQIRTSDMQLPPGAQEGAPAGPYVILQVSDTGLGMDEETQRRIFEPFFTTKERGKGTGLGLSTVYGIVRQSGGFISVDSKPGEGTTFTLFFPRLEPDQTTQAPVLEPAPGVTRANVLLVEDDPSLRDLVQRVLERKGYRVLSASNGREALQILEEAPSLQLLITDVVMPEMDGPQLADLLRQKLPQVKVLFMSGYTEHDLRQYENLSSSPIFLQKPFSPDELLQRVESILSQPPLLEDRSD